MESDDALDDQAGGAPDQGDQSDVAVARLEAPSGSLLTATFLDVGQGDATILECDGHWMLIDGGPPEASSTLYSFIKRNGIESFDMVVATHPDTDHTGGVAGALEAAGAKRAYCSVTDADKRAFQAMKSRLDSQGVGIEVPQVGDEWSLGSARIEVIGPVERTDGDGDANNDSIMLKVTHGKDVFVFTGDADENEERGAARFLDGCDVLKVAHHGSAGSSSYAFLRAANPKFAVISCGSDNSYGHPTESALSRFRDQGAQVFRTDLQGDVTAVSDGAGVSMQVAKSPEADVWVPGGKGNSNKSSASQGRTDLSANASTSSDGYIGNKNSKKFHLPTCKTLPKPANQVQFSTRQEAVDAGYAPCGNCHP